jgi:hypothetical protein
LARCVGNGGLVLLRRRQLEVFANLPELRLDALQQRKLDLGSRTLPQDGLGSRRVVPKALAQRALGELVQGTS